VKVSVTSEYRFTCLPDGSVWTETAFPYSYWQRYLGIFEEVKIIARVKTATTVDANWKRVDGSHISVLPLPDYLGPLGYFKARGKIRKKMKEYLSVDGAIVLAVPSPIALVAEKIIIKKKLVYGVEMMGDPWEVFSGSGIQHPLRIYFRHSLTRATQRQVYGASSVSYVTQNTLQKRYPSSPHSLSTGVSNIDLLPDHVATCPRVFTADEKIRLISVGSLEQLYKNPDVVLKSVANCIKNGLNISLTWIGGGKYLSELTALSNSLGLAEHVQFLGQVPAGELIRKQLDEANLFVLASKTEGLPRALIEAMARGLPCIGSNVGGIPELLEPEELFQANDPVALQNKIEQISKNRELMALMSQKNLLKSQPYLKENLDQKRSQFLAHLKDQTFLKTTAE